MEGKEFGFGFKLTLNDQLTNSLKNAAAGINQFSGQFNSFVGLIKSATYALVGFYTTSRALQSIRQLLYFGQDLEQKQVQLQALTGSLKEAKGLFEFARKKSEELPFGSITEILGAVKAMNLFGFNAQKHFSAIAGLAAVSGESLESVVYNLNFFTQSGFARGLARMGVNVKELQKATQGLRAGTDEFREATIKFIGSQEKFKNAVGVQRNTLAGLRDDIHDVFEAFKLDILGLNSENGLMGGYKRFLRQIRNFLVEHKEGLRQIAEAIGKVLGGVFDILGGAFTRMTKKFGDWIDTTGNFLRGHQDLITQFVFWLGLIELRVESIFATALTWTNKFVEALGGWQAVLTGLAAGGIVGTILSIANAVKTFGGALGLTNPYIWAGVAAITAWTIAYKELQSLGFSMSDMTGKDWLGTGEQLLTGGAFRGTPASKTIHTSPEDSAAARDKIRSIDSSVNKGATYNVVFPNVRTAEQAKNTLDTLSAQRTGVQRNPRTRGAALDPRLDPEYIIHHKWQ